MFNNIIDPQWDWPLKEKTLIDYIDSKYSANGAANTTVQTGIAWAMSTNNVQSYFKIITRTSFDGTETIEKLSVDANTYANVSASSTTYTLQDGTSITQTVTKETQSYYQYEVDLNEAKRTIKLIKPEFVPAIEKEFKKVIK